MEKRGLSFLLLIAVAGPVGLWHIRLETIRAEYASECPRATTAGQPPDDWSAGISSMKEQSALLLNWALVGLGGTIALITTTGTHPFRVINWLFLLLAPALSLLAGSLWAGLLFQRRVTHLELNKCTAGGTLNDLLLAQSDLLLYGIFCMGCFALICLVQIILGLVDPSEAKS